MRKKLSRILPWVVTLALLFYVFQGLSLADMKAALAAAAAWTIPVLAVLIIGVYLGDSFAIWKTFGWFVTRLSFREVLVVRGATYLLALVHYTVGQGAIIYFVNRSRGVPLLRGTAAILLVMGINILLLLVFASIGLLIAPDLSPVVRKVVFGAYGALAVYAVLLLLRPRWLTSRPIFDVLFAAGLSGHLRALLVRIPHVGILMVFSYASLHAFGVQLPASQAILYLPIVYFIAALPISVMGLGVNQLTLAYFFYKYVPNHSPEDARKLIEMASLGAQAVSLVVQVVLGLFCMRSQIARGLNQVASTE